MGVGSDVTLTLVIFSSTENLMEIILKTAKHFNAILNASLCERFMVIKATIYIPSLKPSP